MPSYEFCYVDSNGSLLGYVSTQCSGDHQAIAFARMMVTHAARRVEMWKSGRLEREWHWTTASVAENVLAEAI